MSAKDSDQNAQQQSIAELFHLVKSLLPESRHVETVSPSTPVGKALATMKKYKFSQLPIVSGDAVLGVFSYRAFAHQVHEMGTIDVPVEQLPVDEFREQFAFVQLADNWESMLDYLNSDDGVLVGHRDGLEGIVTAMDVLSYLHRIASPFVLIAEMELSLRRIIQACVSEEELQECIRLSLKAKYESDEMPGHVDDMTFNDYVQVICDGRNWPNFADVFGVSEWQRKTTSKRLKEVRELRNDVFHFRRPLTEEDRAALTKQRDWLQMKARAYEGMRKKKKVPDSIKRKGRTDRARFLANCTPVAASFFEYMLAASTNAGHAINWGEKGFSVRKTMNIGRKLVSFAYGYPPAGFSFYFGYLPLSAGAANKIRQDLLAFNVFEESGQYTLKAAVTKQNSDQLRDVYHFVLDMMREIG